MHYLAHGFEAGGGGNGGIYRRTGGDLGREACRNVPSGRPLPEQHYRSVHHCSRCGGREQGPQQPQQRQGGVAACRTLTGMVAARMAVITAFFMISRRRIMVPSLPTLRTLYATTATG